MRRTSYTPLPLAFVALTTTWLVLATGPGAAGQRAANARAVDERAPATPASFAIVNARIVDGTGQPPFDGTIVVENGRIAAVGPSVRPPAGVQAIDGRGFTVTPGLFDLHVHLFARAGNPLASDVAKHLAAYLYCGVTSVAELGSDPESFEPIREMLSSGRMRGPHVSLAARLAVPGGHGAEGGRAELHTALVVTEREAHAAVRRIAPYRPDLLKVFADGWRYGVDPNLPSMTPEALSAIATDARTHRLPVFTHTVTVAGAHDAAESGVSVLAHGIGDTKADNALARLLRDRDMTYVSTLSVYEPRDHRRTTPLLWKVVEPWMRERGPRPATAAAAAASSAIGPAAPSNAPSAGQERRATPAAGSAPPADGRAQGGAAVVDRGRAPGAAPSSQAAEARSATSADVLRARQRRWERLMQNVATFRAAGVRIGVGTDAGMPSAPHGWSTLLELRLLVEAGLTPLEALTAATGHSATALGVQADRGVIAVGRRADLLLVPGDPTTDVAKMEQVERVFMDGVEVDRPALEAMMTSADLSPLAPVAVEDALIDDFEGDEGRSDRGARWMDATEAGPHPTELVYGRVLRAAKDHALHVSASMSDARAPFARVSLSMVRGGLQPVDVRAFTGIRFDARGDGSYRLIASTRAVRDGRHHEATFNASPTWTPVTIPFDRLTQRGSGTPTPWTGADLLDLAFEFTREPRDGGWLEIDNVRFHREAK